MGIFGMGLTKNNYGDRMAAIAELHVEYADGLEDIICTDETWKYYGSDIEATAHFMRNGKHYLLTSGTTGYFPNPSEVAIADTWHGPYIVLGNPHPGDESNTSYHSQISSVLKVEGKKDLYIACADRWCLEDMDLPYDFYREMFEYIFQGKANQIPELIGKYGVIPPAQDDQRNTSIANYVWLPLRFDGENVIIDWLDEWRIEDYE